MSERSPQPKEESLLRSRVMQVGAAATAVGVLFELGGLAVIGLGIMGGKWVYKNYMDKK